MKTKNASAWDKRKNQLGAAALVAVVAVSLYSIYSNRLKKTQMVQRASATLPVANQDAHAVLAKAPTPVRAQRPPTAQPIETGGLSRDDGKTSPVQSAHVPEVVNDVLSDGDRVIKAFSTVNELTAWVIKESREKGGASVVYLTTSDNRFLFSGSFHYKNRVGESMDLIEQIAKRYTLKMSATALWDSLSDSAYVAEGAQDGEGVKVIYAFFDPNCIYCHLSWLAFKPYLHVEDIQVRWVPVSVLAEEGASQLAYLWQSENPFVQFTKSNTSWDIESEESPFPMAQEISIEAQYKIEKNNQYLHDLGITGSPAFVYKDASGKINIANGAIKLSDIPEMFQIEEIPNYDPRLRVLN